MNNIDENYIEEFAEWMTRNPDMAYKHYPEIMQMLTEQFRNLDPYLWALIIQKIPDNFPDWKTKAEQFFGIKKTKMIQEYIHLINAVLTEYKYPSEIEQQAFESVRAELEEQLEYWNKELKALTPQPIVKQKTELNGKIITFKNNETIEKIHSELKGYFPNKEAELLKALQGEQLSEMLLFPYNQNKFVEVFRRLKYNGFLLNTDTETKNWICTTFSLLKEDLQNLNRLMKVQFGTILIRAKANRPKRNEFVLLNGCRIKALYN